MNGFCAKPACSRPATKWFDVSREQQVVYEQPTPTVHGIALCDVHAARFNVPVGWTIVTDEVDAHSSAADQADAEVAPVLGDAAEVEAADTKSTDTQAESTEPQETVVRQRGVPWFVPSGELDESEDSQPASSTASGSLLDRAFNGPKQRSGKRRPESVTPKDELSSRRRARSKADEPEEGSLDAYETFQIPFPPHARTKAAGL